MTVSDEIITKYIHEKIINPHYSNYEVKNILFKHEVHLSEEYIYIEINFLAVNFNITKSAYINKGTMDQYKRDILTDKILKNGTF